MVKAVNGQIAGLFLPPVSGIFTERELKLEVNTWNGGIFQTTQTLLPDSAKKTKTLVSTGFTAIQRAPKV